jgi:Cys-rich repeat protein
MGVGFGEGSMFKKTLQALLVTLLVLAPAAVFACAKDADCGPCNVCTAAVCGPGPNVLCAKDSDCPGGQVCAINENACLNMCVDAGGCTKDTDCFKCQFCIIGSCQGPDKIECTSNAQCKAGFFCKVDAANDCNNKCLQEGTCQVDADCKQCQVCIGGTCNGAGLACTADQPCPWPKKCKIDPASACNNVCISGSQCVTSEDCGPCKACMDGGCVDAGVVLCEVNADCMKGQICKVDAANPCNNLCVPYVNCIDDGDCDDCEACLQGKCTQTGPMECMSALDCDVDEICLKTDPANFCLNVCVSDTSCNTDADCDICEACVGGTCIGGLEVLCIEDDDCNVGEVCNLDGKDPCKNFCSPPQPDCVVDDDCGPCEVCQSFMCYPSAVVPPCTEEVACPEPFLCEVSPDDPCENKCVEPPPECVADADCAVCNACTNGKCVSIAEIKCVTDKECDDGLVCDNDPANPCIVQCVEPGVEPDVVVPPEDVVEQEVDEDLAGQEDVAVEDAPVGKDLPGPQEDASGSADSPVAGADTGSETTPSADTAEEVDGGDGGGGGGGGGCAAAGRTGPGSAAVLLLLALAVLAAGRKPVARVS